MRADTHILPDQPGERILELSLQAGNRLGLELVPAGHEFVHHP